MLNKRQDFARTKIVWSLSPNSFVNSLSDLSKSLISKKVDSVLTVFSSKRIEKYQELRQNFVEELKDKSVPDGEVAFLFSLMGRRAFCFLADAQMNIEVGQKVKISCVADIEACLQRKDPIGGAGVRIVASGFDVFSELVVGSSIQFGYGEMEIKITSIEKRSNELWEAEGESLVSGSLTSGADVSSKDLRKNLFPLIEHDSDALEKGLFGLADALILHGVTNVEEVEAVKAYLSKIDTKNFVKPLLLLRVDSKAALDLVPVLIENIDGMFLNRSELGMSVHPHSLPLVQKDLIAQCNMYGKTIIVSSDLVSSMRKNPNPTRAEVSDLANLVIDGVDAVVLGREITEGPYADEAASYCRETIVDSENSLALEWPKADDLNNSNLGALAYAALHAAKHISAKAIVCLTRQGFTAGRLSSIHAPIDIIALTYSSGVMRQLQIMHSLRPLLIEKGLPMEQLFAVAKEKLAKEFGFVKGDKLIFVSLRSMTETRYDSNLFAIEEYV